MDILYILGEGSSWDNNELRLSLRSLYNCYNLDRVFVIGTDPKLLSKNVIFIPYVDLHNRFCNHYLKVKKVFEETDISDNILLMYDDIFFKRTVDIEEYPYYCEGELPVLDVSRRAYIQSLGNTRQILEKYNKPIIDFSVHCPIIYNRQKFLALKDTAFKDMFEYQNGADVRSLYANMNNIQGEQVKDCLVLQENDFEKVKDFNCFSINDKSLENGIGQLVANKYKEKCIYEVYK